MHKNKLNEKNKIMSEETNNLVVIPQEVTTLAEKVAVEKREEVNTILNQLFAGTESWKQQISNIKVKDHTDTMAMQMAGTARLSVKKARLEAERVQREKAESEQREARLKAEKEAAELRAQQAAENERKRIEAEQAAKAEAERKAEEARLANVEHRRQINREALEAIKGVCPDLTEPQIKALVGAIIGGLIPHVSIKY